MDAPSDGAIVLTVLQPTRAPTVREILSWYIPDIIIAVWLGATMGGCLSHYVVLP